MIVGVDQQIEARWTRSLNEKAHPVSMHVVLGAIMTSSAGSRRSYVLVRLVIIVPIAPCGVLPHALSHEETLG